MNYSHITTLSKCTVCGHQFVGAPNGDSPIMPYQIGRQGINLQNHTRPHYCSICKRDPHNFVDGKGWVDSSWWGTEDSKAFF